MPHRRPGVPRWSDRRSRPALLLGELFAATDPPPGAWSVLAAPDEVAAALDL